MRYSRRQICVSSFRTLSALALTTAIPGLGCGIIQKPSEPDLLNSIAFGSCNKQDMLTKHWPVIDGKSAQGWLWMGDAVYADLKFPRDRFKEYQKVMVDQGYRDLAARSFILGTWDDHDYAANDAGIDYELKKESQKVFLDFIGEPLDSTRREQKGIYSSKSIGKAGSQIQFILLDMRYFKEKAGISADPMGAAQWQWFSDEIKKVGPALKVVVSSIQALTDFSGKDTWACYPDAQKRFFTMLATSPVQVLILSGDRHLTESARLQVAKDKVVHEITSSGLTHTTDLKNENIWRVQDQINQTNFGVLNFRWDMTGKPALQGIQNSIYSPQEGSLLRDLDIPFQWG